MKSHYPGWRLGPTFQVSPPVRTLHFDKMHVTQAAISSFLCFEIGILCVHLPVSASQPPGQLALSKYPP